MATSSTSSRRRSATIERTGQWVFSQDIQIPTDLVITVSETSFPLHKFMMMSKSGYMRNRVLGSERSTDPTRIDLSDIPGGVDAFERAVKFCYGVNFDITGYNAAALRCAAEYLDMTERACDGNLALRAEEFLEQAALRTLPGAVIVLRSCEALGGAAEEVGLVQRCVDVISLKACSEATSPSRAPSNWWLHELTSLPASFIQRILTAMKTYGASTKALAAVIVDFGEKSLPDFLHPLKGLNSTLPLSDPSPVIRTHQSSLVESIISLPKTTAVALPVPFLCLLLRATIFLNSSTENRRELEKLIAADLDRASAGDLLAVALDCPRGRVVDLDSVRRIISGSVEMEGGRLYGGRTVSCSAALQKVARTVDAFVAEIAADEELSVSKFAGVAGALPKSARRFDDDLYRAVDIYLKVHPGLDEIEKEKVCSVMDPLRLSYEARLHASQNKRLPLQVVLPALYYDQLKLRGGIDDEPAPPPLSAAALARSKVGADVSLVKENEELRSELAMMKLYMSDLERSKKVGKKPATFFASVSKTLGKLNPFGRQGSKDTASIDDGGVRAEVAAKPRRRRFSIS